MYEGKIGTTLLFNYEKIMRKEAIMFYDRHSLMKDQSINLCPFPPPSCFCCFFHLSNTRKLTPDQ